MLYSAPSVKMVLQRTVSHKKESCFHMVLQHYVAYLPKQGAGNCYQLPARGPRSDICRTKLLLMCQIPHGGFKIFNDSINIYVKKWGVGMRPGSSCGHRHVVCPTVKIRTCHINI